MDDSVRGRGTTGDETLACVLLFSSVFAVAGTSWTWAVTADPPSSWGAREAQVPRRVCHHPVCWGWPCSFRSLVSEQGEMFFPLEDKKKLRGSPVRKMMPDRGPTGLVKETELPCASRVGVDETGWGIDRWWVFL